MINRLTFDDLLESGSSPKFEVAEVKGKPRVIKKVENRPPELYENETALKKAAADLLERIPRCELFKTDNQPLMVGKGRKAKSREPGMADQHLCIYGLFVALEAKMPGKDLDPKKKQPEYRDKVHRGEGIHITYHSLYELVQEMKKHRLLSQRFQL
jgi:hypothetical protein